MELFQSSKLIYHFERIVEWQKTGISHPILLEVDMTNSCDHKCPSCVYSFARNADKLNLSETISLLYQAKELGVLAVVITGGGEPLINPVTPEVIQSSKRIGMEVGLITHGGQITKSIAQIIALNCTWCRISLDAATPFMYRQTHDVNEKAWRNTITGIENLVSAKLTLASDVTIGVGYLVNEKTIREAISAVELSGQLGVDYIQFRPFRETRFDIRPLMPEIKKQSTIANLKVLCSEGRYNSIDKPRSYLKCKAPNFAIVAGADQKVYVCCDTKYRDKTRLGDLKTQTLAEIWYGEIRKSQNGQIYQCCPQPCRHNANNQILANVESVCLHKNFI